MKSKILFLILSIFLGASSYFALNYYLNQNETINNFIKSIQSKNIDMFYESTDINKISENLGEEYSLYASKTTNEDNTISNTINSIKSNFLGFVYKKFTGDILLIIDSFFSGEKEYTLFYDSEDILGFINQIDLSKTRYEKITKNTYRVFFFQKKLNKEFSFLAVTSLDSDGKEKISEISDFHILLSKIEKESKNYLDLKNDEIKKDIDKTLQITFFETKINNRNFLDGSLNFTIVHNIKTKNLTDKTIFGFKYKIWVYNPNTEQMAEKVIESNQKIYPNAEISETANNINPQFHYFVENYNLYPKAEITEIDFFKYKIKYIKKIEW